MKKILFPTDFSEAADNAFIYALEIANVLKAELVLLHTFDLPVVDNQFFPENYMDIFITAELSQFEHFKDKIAKLRQIAGSRNLEKIPMSHMLMEGDLIYNIEKAVKKEVIDFVIMGTSGASGWKEFFFGTTTGSVINDISVPVLSVALDSKFHKIETIVFTTKFRDKDIKALQKVLDFAKDLNAFVKCLYVKTNETDVDESTIHKWENQFEGQPIQFFVIPDNDVKQTIQDFLSFQNADMLAMLTYKRGFFEEFYNQSLTQKLSYEITTPILALHE